MLKKLLFTLSLLVSLNIANAQEKLHKFAIGLDYGFGNELKNTDYTYTNRYLKGQLYYKFRPYKKHNYEILIQPEINFATHQLINMYFVTPDEPDYEEKRAEYTKLKDIREYSIGFGFLYRRIFSDHFSMYVLGSVGPMVTDTETERLSKGFAFQDTFSLGFSYKTNGVNLDFRPNLRHISNAGLQNSNAGFNTLNFEFGISFPL